MKRTVDLNAIDIADRPSLLVGKTTLIALAVEGLNVPDPIIRLAHELGYALAEIKDEIHPPLSEKEMEQIRWGLS
jgi:hypothetical protein